eukprot:532212_1
MSMSISLITNVCHDVYQNVSTNLYLLVVTIQISRTRTSIQRINKNTSTVTMSFNSLSFKMLIVALGVVAMKISNTMIDRFLKNKFYIYHLIADFKYIVKWNIKITNHCLNILKSKYKRNQIKSAIKHINKELKPRKSATGSCMVKKCKNKAKKNCRICQSCFDTSEYKCLGFEFVDLLGGQTISQRTDLYSVKYHTYLFEHKSNDTLNETEIEALEKIIPTADIINIEDENNKHKIDAYLIYQDDVVKNVY